MSSDSPRPLLLSVALALCALLVLPTTLGAIHSPKARGNEDNSELVELLKQLRERLHNAEADEETNYHSIHDNFKEHRSLDEIMLSSAKQRRGKSPLSKSSSVRDICPPLPDTTLTHAQQTQLVDAMNSRRKSEGAGDMHKLYWNAQLAKLGQEWSDQCNFKHGSCAFDMSEVGFANVGQNIYASDGQFDADQIVDSWYSQKANFSTSTQTCVNSKICEGYKQLVTGFTTDVGCGMTRCPTIGSLTNANFVVCFFGPPGNVDGVKTFRPGQSCTLCRSGQFLCNDGFCDNRCTAAGSNNCKCAANCQQCGSVTSDCRCECNAGSSGVACEHPCEDTDGKCGKRWPASYCNIENFSFVREFCPRMCKLCEAGTPCNGEAPAPAPGAGAGEEVEPGPSRGEGEYAYFENVPGVNP